MNDSFVRDDKVVQEMVRLKHQVSGNEYGTSRGDSRRERARCVVNQCKTWTISIRTFRHLLWKTQRYWVCPE